MAKLDRNSLKNYFKTGEKPLEAAFADLIDSSFNHIDDDFTTVQDKVLKVVGNEDRRTVLAVYTRPDTTESSWDLYLSPSDELSFRNIKQEALLSFSPTKKVTLNGAQFQIDSDTLKINSKVITQGQLKSCSADGNWQQIVLPPMGINIYEVTAVLKTIHHKNSCLVAQACQSNNKKVFVNRIRPFTFFWQNKIKIKWIKVKATNEGQPKIGLYIRSRYPVRDGEIQYRIIQKWQDEDKID